MKHVSLSVLGLAIACALSVGCRHVPERRGLSAQVLNKGTLAEHNPSDIVIAPVEPLVDGLEVPDIPLRKAFQKGLIKRRYSPLALDFVDSRVVEAAYRPGTLGEDAVCRILVHSWDMGAWDTRTAIRYDLEVRLVDPADPYGPSLWTGRLADRLDMPRERQRIPTEGQLLQEACDRIAAEICAVLPARRTDAGE